MASTCGSVFKESSVINFASWSDKAKLHFQQLNKKNIQQVLASTTLSQEPNEPVSVLKNTQPNHGQTVNASAMTQVGGTAPIQLLTANHLSRMIQYAYQSVIEDLFNTNDGDDSTVDVESEASNPQEVNKKERSMLYLVWCIVDHRAESSLVNHGPKH